MTKNLHLEHPEDQILSGDLSVLDWFAANSHISVKMDGAPALVWGTNPENNRFFVGTKSVFNKKKVMICYTPEDIALYYSHNHKLQDILLTCLDYLPRTNNIYQGDFIGYGMRDEYTPNTITYKFDEVVQSDIIIAPHTQYLGATIKDSIALPLSEVLDSTDEVMFVQPTVDCMYTFQDSVKAIRKSVEKSKFLSDKQAKEVRIILNAFIREGKSISPQLLEQIVGDWTLTQAYFQVLDIKEQMMESMVVYDGPKSFIGDMPVACEGYVRSNKFGSMKLVDRYQFAQANFNNTRFRSN